MKANWTWVFRYVVVMILAVVLAAALGEMTLFKTTKFGKSGLNAAHLAQFLGFGGALSILWLLAQRAAAAITSRDPRWSLLQNTLVPLATLIVIASGQAVLLLLLGPLMSKAWHEAYNWFFVAAIMASAAWLVATLFTGSSSLAPLFRTEGRALGRQDAK
jgi:hypothetical protein